MFLYKDNRFHFNDVSFGLPNNVILNTNCDEYDDSIELLIEDNFRIIIFCRQSDKDAKQFFDIGEVEECYQWVGEMSSAKISNLTSYTVFYKSNYNSYAEYHFDVNGKNKNNVLGILIHWKEEVDISKAVNHKCVQELLNSLKRE